jgi:hypothetical protein
MHEDRHTCICLLSKLIFKLIKVLSPCKHSSRQAGMQKASLHTTSHQRWHTLFLSVIKKIISRFILTHASTCRHLTSFVVSSRDVYSSTNSGDNTTPSPSDNPKQSKSGSGSGPGTSKDPIIKIPGRKSTVNGGYSGFAEVVFLLGRRQEAQKIAVSLDGTKPKCQQQYFLTSVSIIHPVIIVFITLQNQSAPSQMTGPDDNIHPVQTQTKL